MTVICHTTNELHQIVEVLHRACVCFVGRSSLYSTRAPSPACEHIQCFMCYESTKVDRDVIWVIFEQTLAVEPSHVAFMCAEHCATVEMSTTDGDQQPVLL